MASAKKPSSKTKQSKKPVKKTAAKAPSKKRAITKKRTVKKPRKKTVTKKRVIPSGKEKPVYTDTIKLSQVDEETRESMTTVATRTLSKADTKSVSQTEHTNQTEILDELYGEPEELNQTEESLPVPRIILPPELEDSLERENHQAEESYENSSFENKETPLAEDFSEQLVSPVLDSRPVERLAQKYAKDPSKNTDQQPIQTPINSLARVYSVERKHRKHDRTYKWIIIFLLIIAIVEGIFAVLYLFFWGTENTTGPIVLDSSTQPVQQEQQMPKDDILPSATDTPEPRAMLLDDDPTPPASSTTTAEDTQPAVNSTSSSIEADADDNQNAETTTTTVTDSSSSTLERVIILSTGTGFLNVRADAGTQFARIAQVSPGETYVVLDTNDAGTWLELQITTDLTGWVSSRYTSSTE